VAIQGQLHVERNAIIGGGMMVEGELGCLHVTAPFEYRQTELCYGLENMMEPLMTVPDATEHVHVIPPHTHFYKHIAWTPCFSQVHARDLMIFAGINSKKKLAAALPAAGVVPAGDYGPLDQAVFEEKVGGPSDSAALSLGVGAIGRNPLLPKMSQSGNIVTYKIYYNFNKIGGGFVERGIEVITTVDISGEEPTVKSGPNAAFFGNGLAY